MSTIVIIAFDPISSSECLCSEKQKKFIKNTESSCTKWERQKPMCRKCGVTDTICSARKRVGKRKDTRKENVRT